MLTILFNQSSGVKFKAVSSMTCVSALIIADFKAVSVMRCESGIITAPFSSVSSVSCVSTVSTTLGFQAQSELSVSSIDLYYLSTPNSFYSKSTPSSTCEIISTAGFDAVSELSQSSTLILTGFNFSAISSFGDVSIVEFSATENAITRYFLTLTGAENSLIDLVLPLASFQARKRSCEQTYLSVVVPTLDYSVDISNRPDGNIRIFQGYEVGGEIIQRELILETSLDRVDVYQGTENQSMTLTGYKQSTYSPKALSISACTYRAVQDGKLRFRLAKPEIYLNPGDTATIGTESIIVGVVSYTISPTTFSLEIEEA